MAPVQPAHHKRHGPGFLLEDTAYDNVRKAVDANAELVRQNARFHNRHEAFEYYRDNTETIDRLFEEGKDAIEAMTQQLREAENLQDTLQTAKDSLSAESRDARRKQVDAVDKKVEDIRQAIQKLVPDLISPQAAEAGLFTPSNEEQKTILRGFRTPSSEFGWTAKEIFEGLLGGAKMLEALERKLETAEQRQKGFETLQATATASAEDDRKKLENEKKRIDAERKAAEEALDDLQAKHNARVEQQQETITKLTAERDASTGNPNQQILQLLADKRNLANSLQDQKVVVNRLGAKLSAVTPIDVDNSQVVAQKGALLGKIFARVSETAFQTWAFDELQATFDSVPYHVPDDKVFRLQLRKFERRSNTAAFQGWDASQSANRSDFAASVVVASEVPLKPEVSSLLYVCLSDFEVLETRLARSEYLNWIQSKFMQDLTTLTELEDEDHIKLSCLVYLLRRIMDKSHAEGGGEEFCGDGVNYAWAACLLIRLLVTFDSSTDLKFLGDLTSMDTHKLNLFQAAAVHKLRILECELMGTGDAMGWDAVPDRRFSSDPGDSASLRLDMASFLLRHGPKHAIEGSTNRNEDEWYFKSGSGNPNQALLLATPGDKFAQACIWYKKAGGVWIFAVGEPRLEEWLWREKGKSTFSFPALPNKVSMDVSWDSVAASFFKVFCSKDLRKKQIEAMNALQRDRKVDVIALPGKDQAE